MTTAMAAATPDEFIDVVPGSPVLEIEREFDAPIGKVFDAWTTADGLRTWMGPEGVTAPDAVCDARAGGTYCVPMVMPDGSVYAARGTYHIVDRPHLLVFTWSWDHESDFEGSNMLITLKFEDIGDHTRLSFQQVNFIDEEARNKHSFGWNSSFDCLAVYLVP